MTDTEDTVNGLGADSDSEVVRPFFRLDPLASIVLVVTVFFVTQIVGVLILGLCLRALGWSNSQITTWFNDTIYAQFYYVLIVDAMLFGTVWLLLKLSGNTFRSIGLVKPVFADIVRAFVSYGVYFVLLIIAMVLIETYTSINTSQEQKTGFADVSAELDYLAAFVSLVVLPPIVEELLFRGFLYSSLRRKMHFFLATLVTSVAFGAAHLQFGSGEPLLWVVAIDTFILSVVMCYLREKTSSVWSAIFLHAIKNSIAYLVLFGAQIFW